MPFNKVKIDETYNWFCGLKSKIYFINIFELDRLIEKVNDGRKKSKKKYVIFIIENIGKGKSTKILKVLCYNLKIKILVNWNSNKFPEAKPCTNAVSVHVK